MINFNNSFSSFTKGQDDLSRRRREIAQAFEQFKANNPYANMDDFQYFIDSNVDLGMGSNYLRGGAPSRQILQKVADQNERDRVRAEKKKILADAIEQGNFRGQLTGAADKFLLENDGDTLKAKNALTAMFGDNIDYDAFGVGDSYFEGRYDTLIQDRLQNPQNVTALTNYLNSLSLDQLNSLEAANLKKIFDLPETTSDTYLQSSIKQAEEVKRNKQLAQNEKIMSLVEAAAAKGDANVEAVIRNYFGGNEITDTEFKELTKNMDFTQYQSRADEIIQEKNDIDTRDMNKSLRDAYNALRVDPQFTSAMRVGDKAAAKEALIKVLGDVMLPRHIADKFGLAKGEALEANNAALDGYFDELYTMMQQYQVGQIQAEYEKKKVAAATKGPELIQKNIKTTAAILARGMDKNVADSVAVTLGSNFFANDDALVAAMDAVNAAAAENKDLSLGERMAIMQQTLVERGAIPMQTYISEQGAAALKDIPQRPMTMEEYTTSEMSDLEADFTTLGDNLFKLKTEVDNADTAEGLIDLQRKLAAIKSQLNSFAAANQTAQDNALKSADGVDANGLPTGWLQYGEALDIPAIERIKEYITSYKGDLDELINRINATIATKISALPPPPEVQTERDVDEPSTTQSDLSVTVGNYVKEFGIERMIANQVGLADRGGIVGKIMQPFMFVGRELYENTMLTQEEELRREATRNWASQNLARLTEYGRLLATADALEFSYMMNNLAIKTPEELEDIYGEALDLLAEEGRFRRPNT